MSCTILIMLSQAIHSKFLYNEFTMNFYSVMFNNGGFLTL